MFVRRFALSFAALTLATSLTLTALAAVDGVAPAGGGGGVLAVHVDLPGRRVLYETCSQAPCGVGPQSPSIAIPIDPASLPDPKDVSTDLVPISGGRNVVHVRVPLRGGDGPLAPAWEGLFAAGAPPLFAARTGWIRGESGERTGTAITLLADGETRSILVGDVREDLRICGDDSTLLNPQGLDPRLVWHGATFQRLSPARREKAIPLVASLRGGAPADAPLGQLLAAEGASTAIGAPKNLVDGDPDTTWSEGRLGQGQGEFALFHAPHEVPLTRFAVVVAPKTPRPEGAAPRTFYLATDTALFEVTMPEDAWGHPGAAYDISLPEPVATSCVALVLGDAYLHGSTKPEVTVGELFAYSAFDGPGVKLDTVVQALSGGGPRAEVAAGVLKRSGPAGLQAAALAYAKLDPAGRALAVDVAASSPSCAPASQLLVEALSDPGEIVREKARAKLEQPHCGRDAVPALVASLGVPATRSRSARLLASVAPSQALAPLARVLGQGSPQERAQLRSAFAHAAAQAAPGEIAVLLAAGGDPDARVDLLRAAEGRLGEVSEAADRALDDLLGQPPSVRTRYLLVAPTAALARAGDAKDDARLVLWLEHDSDPLVRVHAAEMAGASAKTQAALDAAAKDPEPRVREAALRTVAASRVVPAGSSAIAALGHDPWTFVRAAAAEALAMLPASVAADQALDRAVRDKAARVRAVAISALAGHAAVASVGTIRSRLEDTREDVDVRVAAAHALGGLCDLRALDALERLAISGASSPDPNDVALGLAATDALGQLHPADLAKRLKGVHTKGARPDAQRAADAAVSAPGVCRRPSP